MGYSIWYSVARSAMLSSSRRQAAGGQGADRSFSPCTPFSFRLRLSVSRLEKPAYLVSKTIRVGRGAKVKAEVREYEPYLIAESVVSGDTMREGTSKGFMNVAG